MHLVKGDTNGVDEEQVPTKRKKKKNLLKEKDPTLDFLENWQQKPIQSKASSSNITNHLKQQSQTKNGDCMCLRRMNKLV
jgi:hypothetical protein